MNELPVHILLKNVSRVENEPYLSLTLEISSGGEHETRVLVISEKYYREMKLSRGELSRESFDGIEAESKLCAAYRRGIGILGYGANSEKALTRKLKQRGFDAQNAQKAAALLKSEGCINEERDIGREIDSCLAKLWGERRILAKLYEKGYGETAIASARKQLVEVDFVENCALLIRKRYISFPSDRNDAKKATAALVRYGYTVSQIREARTIGGNI